MQLFRTLSSDLKLAGIVAGAIFVSSCIFNFGDVSGATHVKNGVLIVTVWCAAWLYRRFAHSKVENIDSALHSAGLPARAPVEEALQLSDANKQIGEQVVDVLDELDREREKLAANEERTRLMFDSCLDAVITINETGLVTDWNPQAEKTFGWSRAEAVNSLLTQLIIPDQYRERHRLGIERFLTTGEGPALNQRLDLSAVRRSGEEFPVELTIVPLKLSHGYHFCAFLRDLTSQRQATAELRERDLRITTLLNSTAEGIYGLDLDGKCTFANVACAHLLKYESPDNFLGLNMHELIHHTGPDGLAAPQHECRIFKAFRDGDDVHADNELFWRMDRTSFPVEYWSYPIRRDDEIIGSVVTFLDISERKQAEQIQLHHKSELETRVRIRTDELTRANEQLDLALTGANVGLWDWNAITGDVYYSPTYKAQLGYSADEGWNHFRDWESNLHPDDHDEALQQVHQYFGHHVDEYKSTFRLKCKDESYRWFLALGRAEFDETDAPTRMIGVHVDITERIESEIELDNLNKAFAAVNEALADALDALEESNVELQQFAYVASHDLQTPLRAISGFAHFLQEDYREKLDSVADNYLERIVAGAKRLQKMIDDLLEYSRVESRAAPFTPIAMNEVYDDAISLLQASIDDCHATITRDDLPTVMGDRAQLSQVMTNLLSNAIKYHASKPTVHVSGAETDDEWSFSVRDEGIGIAPRFHERIFEIFQRLHSKEAFPGTGIGLAVCRRIARRHGGMITVESEEGHGSTFTVVIPKSPVP